MPPSIVLEVMKILEKEIALREETRGVQQAKPQLAADKFEDTANGLADTQEELADRTEAVIDKIIDLPDSEKYFQKEIAQLNNASAAMWDAVEILVKPDTGSEAIAAETEAIEWLLRAKRSKGGGGGGGSSPGNGTREGQDLSSSALALLGESDEDEAQAVKREVQQATGKSGKGLPEEFRFGLDKYFETLEKNR